MWSESSSSLILNCARDKLGNYIHDYLAPYYRFSLDNSLALRLFRRLAALVFGFGR
jgi:hypothetical protein